MNTQAIIFGSTGDLARQKLLPTLFGMSVEGLLPEDFSLYAVGRRDYTTEQFLAELEPRLRMSRHYSEGEWQKFSGRITYYRLDIANTEEYAAFSGYLSGRHGEVANRLFYLAVPPETYPAILENLAASGLHRTTSTADWSRIVVEKPIGHDQVSARQLNELVSRCFDERDVYRVDHYLGKETVQNILAFRFANGVFEPLWNADHIDHIQVTVAEEEGIGARGAFYDQTGALRDFVQNHILQLVSILTMEEPVEYSHEALSQEKMKVLQQLRIDLGQTVLGQYEGYADEPNVVPGSTTETFVATALYIDSTRWSGVPVYIRTGKKLARRISEVSVQFKETRQHLFSYAKEEKRANVLTFRIQPDEGIALQLGVKTPRQAMQVEPVHMEFCYRLAFRTELPDAYERLFTDIFFGDRMMALPDEVIEESWRIVDELREGCDAADLLRYAPGSWGPPEADALLEQVGRRWLAHESMVCNGVMIDNELVKQ